MRQFVRRIVPGWLRRARIVHNAKVQLGRIEASTCDGSALAVLDRIDLDAVFRSADYEAQWQEAQKEIESLGITPDAHGVNPGDRKALYYLVRHLRPKSILEVGTHIGASTVHLAAAMRGPRARFGGDAARHDLAELYRLTTVDVRDVNHPVAGPWRQFGCGMSPEGYIARLGCEDMVTFVTAKSLEFLAACTQTYDLIFLDGDHSAPTVYQEVSAAAGLINPGGLILLHDFFPGHKPLWSNGVVQPGPSLATGRLQAEGNRIDVVSLGKLPWPTKLDSNFTSLAVLGRSALKAA